MRVYGRGLHGTAQKVIDKRSYVNYSEKSPLARENVSQILASLKNLKRAGPETELDIDETIARTAKNGGEIELVFAREFRDRLKLTVLLDNGGYSMIPYLDLVKSVFGKIRDHFKDLKYYYFHNCLYGAVYKDLPRTRAIPWEAFVDQGSDTHLIIIGDANMAPFELMASNGALYIQGGDRRPGREWLQELRAAFPESVWLNPIPKEHWSHGKRHDQPDCPYFSDGGFDPGRHQKRGSDTGPEKEARIGWAELRDERKMKRDWNKRRRPQPGPTGLK